MISAIECCLPALLCSEAGLDSLKTRNFAKQLFPSIFKFLQNGECFLVLFVLLLDLRFIVVDQFAVLDAQSPRLLMPGLIQFLGVPSLRLIVFRVEHSRLFDRVLHHVDVLR